MKIIGASFRNAISEIQCDRGGGDKKEDARKNKARSDIKRAPRLSTPDFIFYTRGERKKGEREKKKGRREKCAIERKKATRRKGRGR